MPRKKDGMPFEVHPTPAIGKDGKNIVYAKPAMRDKLTMSGVEDFCSRNYGLRYGELSRAFDVFLRAAGELMAMGYRVDTPIGSFAPRLALTREITDPDEVTPRDVRFNGVDYNPGKRWNEVLENGATDSGAWTMSTHWNFLPTRVAWIRRCRTVCNVTMAMSPSARLPALPA